MNNSTNTNTFNYSQYTGPDWHHAASYKPFNSDVLELSVDPTKTKIATALSNFPNFENVYKKGFSKSSFLLVKDSTGYHTYVMTLIADSNYLKNDLNKLDLNKYNKRDLNFSAVVLYSTPDGSYINGWQYSNGKILTQIPPIIQKQTEPVTYKFSSSWPNTKEVSKNTNAIVVETCSTWYQTSYYQDSKGNYISTGTIVLSSSCTSQVYGDLTTGDSIGNGTTTVTSGASGSPATPTPCTVPTLAASAAAESSNHKTLVAHQLPSPIDGTGFPAPTSNSPNPCPDEVVVHTTTETNSPFIILFCAGLTSAEQNSILNTISAFSTEDCPSKYLFNYFGNQTFSFCIKSGNYNVIFNPANNSFTFSTDQAATPIFASLLEHEFFHAFQNATYQGGINSYGQNSSTGINSPGFVNIEFEQTVFNDIARGNYSAFANGTLSQQNAYKGWINGLTNNGTVYPKLTPGTAAYTQFITSYNSFLSQYNALSGNSNISAIINLDPKTLVTLFNNSNPNC